MKYNKSGSQQIMWYRQKITKNTEMWDRMYNIFANLCHGQDFTIEEAYCVYNPLLVTGFITQLYVYFPRSPPSPVTFEHNNFCLGEL